MEEEIIKKLEEEVEDLKRENENKEKVIYEAQEKIKNLIEKIDAVIK